jgi:hypothetical protein
MRREQFGTEQLHHIRSMVVRTIIPASMAVTRQDCRNLYAVKIR